jgi:hypothetical protein
MAHVDLMTGRPKRTRSAVRSVSGLCVSSVTPAVAIGRNWMRISLAFAVLAASTWFAALHARADETEKPKAEKDASSAKGAGEQKVKLRKLQQAALRKVVLASKEQPKKRESQETDPAWKTTHEQTAVIKISKDGKPLPLNNFCLNTDGNILAACGGERIEYIRDAASGNYEPKTVGEPAEIRVLSPDGKLLKTWPLDFTAQAICVADDGTIFVAGGGRVAKLDQEGKVLLTKASPQMAELPPPPPLPDMNKKPDKAAKEARKQKLAEAQENFTKARKAFEEARKDAKLPTDATPEQIEEYQKKLRGPQEKLVAAQQALQEAGTSPEMAAMRKRAEIQQKSAATGIAVSKDDVFVACPMTKTYGYAVWRIDRDFANPKLIIQGLRGCCGQMDVQAKDGDVWVAHNAAHKVERYDRDGKKQLSFGKSDRKAADGFGGCCEPKNLRFGAKGELYASESGEPVVIKKFTTEGKFLGVVAIPKYQTGCVRVTIDVSRDGKQFFILDPGGNAIHVLGEKKADTEKKAETGKKAEAAEGGKAQDAAPAAPAVP